MTEIQLVHLSFGGDHADPRNRFHEIALNEARVASEYRQFQPAAPAQPSFATRLRLAFAGRSIPAADACNCPA
jgi:hypothetical protein